MISKHYPTQKQQKAFDSLVKAFERANKSGLVIYAKSENIVAYTKAADNYVQKEHGFEKCLSSPFSQIPTLTKGVLADSGADDYPCYTSQADKDKFDPAY